MWKRTVFTEDDEHFASVNHTIETGQDVNLALFGQTEKSL